MLKRLVGLTAGLSLLGGLLVAPVASAAPVIDGQQVASYIVPTRHGDIYLEVVHPTAEGKVVKAPAILTYSPYDAALQSRNSDAATWVPEGYARATADLVGTGNSGGCWDYGGIREKESSFDLVEWIAKQKWSSGKIGMIGGSYEGTTANAAAVMKPPHLTTIVPQASISRWYGYAYSGGIRYSFNNEALGHQGARAVDDQGADTPLLFDFGLAVPPPTDPAGENWAERVQSTITPCDEITHTEHGYDDTPDYDDFWIERDYLRDASKVEIPVLVASNWGDWNVKQEESWNWYKALKNSQKRVLYMGTRWEGHGAPSAGHYAATVKKWFDHYLMGKDNGIDDIPSVITQNSNQAGPGKWFRGAPKVTNVVLYPQYAPVTGPGIYPWQLLPTKPREVPSFGPQPDQDDTTAAFPSTNINTESHALHHGQSNHDWFWFESPLVTKDVRIFGQPELQLYSEIGREWVTLTPTLADADPADHVIAPAAGHVASTDPVGLTGITRGFLDSRYRNGLAEQEAITPGELFMANIKMKPTDYTFSKGHYLGLNVQTEILEWALPKPYPGCDVQPDVDPGDPTAVSKRESCATLTIDWRSAKTRLILPVVNAPKDPSTLFSVGHANH